MNAIRFSHEYLKLPEKWVGKEASLLLVREVKLEKLSKAFLYYDTAYTDTDGTIKQYPLPKTGDYLLLLLEADGCIFTTLRRKTGNKLEYYLAGVGQKFVLERVEE